MTLFHVSSLTSQKLPAEITAALNGGASRIIDPVPLCPVRQGRVLFLLSGGLWEFNAENSLAPGAKLLRAAGQTGHGLASRNYALIQLLLQTGLRVGEAARLVVADCELNDRSGLVHVRSGADGKERVVPLSTSARRAIALYLQTREDYSAQDALFVSERGGEAMSLRAMQATIQQLARRAKINRIPVSAHTCRHSFALSFLRRNPGQVTELAALLGHDSLDTTAVYLR